MPRPRPRRNRTTVETRIATAATGEKAVKLFDAEGTLKATYEGHTEPVYAVAFSADGKRVASASADGLVKVWQVDAEK